MWGVDNILPEFDSDVVERPDTDILKLSALLGGILPDKNKSVYKSDFYDETNKADQIHAQVEKFRKEGRIKEANELMNSGNNRALYKVSTDLNRIKKEIGDLNKQINAVKTAPNNRFTTERRKELIDKYTQMANQKAKIGNDMYRKATGQ
jgi:archaellum component FlaC